MVSEIKHMTYGKKLRKLGVLYFFFCLEKAEGRWNLISVLCYVRQLIRKLWRRRAKILFEVDSKRRKDSVHKVNIQIGKLHIRWLSTEACFPRGVVKSLFLEIFRT